MSTSTQKGVEQLNNLSNLAGDLEVNTKDGNQRPAAAENPGYIQKSQTQQQISPSFQEKEE
jgi:hypothetical protein